MKRICLLVCFLIGLFAGPTLFAQGQSARNSRPIARATDAKLLTGIWRGHFITETGQQYRLEFQVDHNGKAVRGVSYSYLDTRFYGKSTMSGSWDASTKKFTIQELRTVELRNSGGGGTCLMNYILDFEQSGPELFLEGTYLGKTEDRKNPAKNGKWGDCGGGRVFLRRVENSDFPEEAFLKNKPAPRRDTVARVVPPVAKTKTPVVKVTPKKPATTTARPPVKTPTKPPVVKTTPPVKQQDPGVTRNSRVDGGAAVTIETPKKIEPRPVVVPVQTRNRENATAKVLQVSSQEILIKLYDNGEIDNDTISVYIDNKLVLANKRLSASPLEFRIKLDEAAPEHVVVMVAENMGRIPPNTSLMIVWDGDKRYDVQITSTEQKNAMVRFRYSGSRTGEAP